MNPIKSKPARRMTAWNERLLVVSFLFILLCTLFPFRFVGHDNFSIAELFDRFDVRFTLSDVISNIVLFMPVGFSVNCLFSTTHKKRFSKLITTFIICAGFSTMVEIFQVFLPMRSPNVVDIVSNSLGGMVGYPIGHFFRKRWLRYAEGVLNRDYRLSLKKLIALFLGYGTLALCIVLALPDPTSLSNWDAGFPLLLGNEKTGDRPWNGTIQMLYISDRALSEAAAGLAFTSNFVLKDSVVAAYPLVESGHPDLKKYRDQSGNLPELGWRGTPTAIFEQGAALENGSWLETIAPAARLAERVGSSSQFTMMTAITTAQLDQEGPARIISQSDSPFHRNFTLGQTGSGLEVRLRTVASDANGTRPAFSVPDFFTDTQAHRVIVTYGNGVLKVYRDGLANVSQFRVPTDFVSGRPETFILYHCLIFVPLGGLLALMIRYQKRAIGVVLIALSAGVPALIFEQGLAIANTRDFSFKNWLLGFLFTAGAMLIVRFGLPMGEQKSGFSKKPDF
jgi:glycopeptide antibiotics resistance protein